MSGQNQYPACHEYQQVAFEPTSRMFSLQGNYCLVTRNEQDFEHTGVKIINPWKEA